MLAERARAIHGDGLKRGFEVGEKSSPGDLVTEIDRAAERAIVEGILAARPHDAILGEEGTNREGTSGVRWVVDPIDGTANYVRGYPSYSVSIGVEVGGRAMVGVVADGLGRRTEGVVGRGAFRDDRLVTPSDRTTLDGAVLATGFSSNAERRAAELSVLSSLIERAADIRVSGSAAFDLCAVASGEVDGYYEVELAPWDVAAGWAIVEAAGAVVRTHSQPDGRELFVAAPAQIVEPLIELLGKSGLSV